jgi:actin cytoskeleton-regulatory complex protein SLA1
MGFLGIYTALYTYVPQSDQELAIKEGDLLYITEKSTEDDWWKAKKRAEGDEDEEPVGLIPSNYIEEVGFRPTLAYLKWKEEICLPIHR